LALIKAVIFDFIGTLVRVKNYDLETSKMKLHRALCDSGFDVSCESFLHFYSQAHEKFRVIRYQKLVEVTNAVWVSEALNSLGFKTTPEDARITAAVNIFFEDYLKSLGLRKCARKMLREFSENLKLGLISNFTYSPLIFAALRKVGINHYFNAILVSEAVGWRKPHGKIFEEALRRLGVKAEETVYVGDSPEEDMKGAKQIGMKTVFVSSQFYPLESLRKSMQSPDIVTKSLCEAYRELQKILNS